jgi:pilus assembly protein Flp/PilA
MRKFRNRVIACLRGFGNAKRGATAIEYALMASGISLAIMSTIWALGTSVKTNLYDKISAIF